MRLKLILGTLIIFFSFGCNFSENLDEANSFIDSFFEQRIKEDSIAPLGFYADSFAENDPAEWERIKTLVEKANGDVISFEKINWQLNNKASTSELSGTFVNYSFKVVYENGEGIERITLLKNSDNPTFKIIGHNYNSEMIQNLVNQGIENAINSDSLDSN